VKNESFWNTLEQHGGGREADVRFCPFMVSLQKMRKLTALRHCTMKWLLHNEVAFSKKPL
jgi:hypothetical protein